MKKQSLRGDHEQDKSILYIRPTDFGYGDGRTFIKQGIR
jgi:hypothetical protein